MILSDRQKEVFKFFNSDYDMLFADGSVRSGKTFSVTHAFLLWTLNFDSGHDFGLAGRTIGTLKRNIIYPYIVPLQRDPLIKKLGSIKFNWAENFFTFNGNTFNWFGGDKETSQFLIQGKTLSGLLMDEVVAMLRSFVDQAMARCSVDGSKIVFTDNPGNPTHYFKTDFIDKAKELNACYMHWSMDDNPSLTPKIRARYERMYDGVFYRRYIKGEWVAAEGLIFPQYANDPARWRLDKAHERYAQLYIGVDFGGTKSKTVFVLAGICGTAQQPQIHILDAHKVKDNGQGVDGVQIAREYAAFFKKAVQIYGQAPVFTFTDHLEALRLQMKKAVETYGHKVVFTDKSISLSEWCKTLNALFNLDILKILAGNDMVEVMFKGLLYDEKADDERPLDDNVTCDIDCYDATRYAISKIIREWLRRGLIWQQ